MSIWMTSQRSRTRNFLPSERKSAPMKIHHAQRQTKTTTAPDFVDITDEVASVVAECDVSSGHVFISSPKGCAVVVNEAESGLLADLKQTFERFAAGPVATPGFGAQAVVLPAENSKLRLGVWQRVLLVELDEPKERSVTIQIVGE